MMRQRFGWICDSVLFMSLVLMVFHAAQARDLPNFENNEQRAQFLLAGAQRIAPADKANYSASMSRIAEAYATLGDVDNASRALMGVDQDKRPPVQCEVAKRLVKAGKVDDAEKHINDLGDTPVTTDLSFFGLGVVDHKAEVREDIRFARHGALTIPQYVMRLKMTKTPKEQQKAVKDLLSAMIKANDMDDFELGLGKLMGRNDQMDILVELSKHQARSGEFPKAYETAKRVGEKEMRYGLLMQPLMKIQAEAGDFAGLTAMGESFAESHPGYRTTAYREIANEQARRGDVVGARASIDQVDEKMRSTVAMDVIFYLLQNKPPQADDAVEILKRYGDAYAIKQMSDNIAVGYAKLGDFEKAKQILANAPRDRNNVEHSYCRCAEAAIEQNKPDMARELLALVQTRLPMLTQSTDRQSVERSITKVYGMLGDSEKVMAMVQQIKMPKDSTVDYQREALEDAGEHLVKANQVMPVLQSLGNLKDGYAQVFALCNIAQRVVRKD